MGHNKIDDLIKLGRLKTVNFGRLVRITTESILEVAATGDGAGWNSMRNPSAARDASDIRMKMLQQTQWKGMTAPGMSENQVGERA